MVYLFAAVTLMVVAVCGWLGILLWQMSNKLARQEEAAEHARVAAEANARNLSGEIQQLKGQVARLSKWTSVADADDAAREMLRQAEEVLTNAKSDARLLTTNAEQQYSKLIEDGKLESNRVLREARAKVKELSEAARLEVVAANEHSARIIAQANMKAESIAGKAYEVVRNAELFEQTARAMRNIIEGYGDEYLKPAESLLDELAEEFSHKDAGKQLKFARDQVQTLIKNGLAAKCDYAENARREGAERFVLDAFNGKVDSILSRVRHDNHGKLEQEIYDAFTIVNYGGKAFRNARVTNEYLQSRLSELKWAVVAQELRRKEQEEQRQIREMIREEERARREYEKAMRDAAKEEDVLRKAMAKAQAEAAAASEEQQSQFEAQLAELQQKLMDAEERNRRAISMAQQTRRGHVYIISNAGSFGDDIYKIGMTRRLEPFDRIKELGDASVPFAFDVHAMIMSDDAPALEHLLHKEFVLGQVNKVNHRKEFYRARLADIRKRLDELGIETKWTMTAEAREFRETQAIERAIEADPDARDQWVNRQLVLEALDDAGDSDEDSRAPEPIHGDEAAAGVS